MPEVLELRQSNDTKVQVNNDAFSWKVELPDSVKKANDLSEHSYLVLTVHNGKVSGELVNVTSELKKESERITNKYRKTFEELKRIGD